MIKAIAIDDEPNALKIIENFCKEIDAIILQKTFTDIQDGLRHLKKFPTDLVFLDLEMSNFKTVDLCSQIKQNSALIFITSNKDSFKEDLKIKPLGYLAKPLTFDTFNQIVDKTKEYFKLISYAKPEYIFVRADYSLQKIVLKDILYIEALDDYLKIHLYQQKTIVARLTMKSLIEKLPSSDFMRVHRSFIVPINKIASYTNKMVLIGDKKIPVSHSYEANVSKLFLV